MNNTSTPPNIVDQNSTDHNSLSFISAGELITLLRTRWLSIASVVVASAIVCILLLYSITPRYMATTTIMIEPTTKSVVNIDEFYEPDANVLYFQTQLAIIKSRDLASRVINKLSLDERKDFKNVIAPKPPAFYADWLPDWLPMGRGHDGLSGAKADQALRSFFLSRLDVTPTLRTYLVNISFNTTEPQLSADIANAIAQEFIEMDLEARVSATEQASSWLIERLDNIKGELEKSEQALQSEREEANLVVVGSSRSLVESELTQNSARLRDATQRRTSLENMVKEIRRARNSTSRLYEVSAIANSDLVKRTRQTYLTAKQQMDKVAARYGPKHPNHIQASAAIRTAERSFGKQVKEAADTLLTEYNLAKSDENTLTEQVQTTKGEIQKLDRNSHSFNVLERDLDTNKQLYELFLQRFKESDIASNNQPIVARVIDPAYFPQQAFFPRFKLTLAVTLLISALSATVLVILSHVLRTSIKNPDDLAKLTNSPVLGVVPVVGGKEAKNLQTHLTNNADSRYAESIRSIRTALKIAMLDSSDNVLMVTSTTQGEGKTTISVNLSICCASEMRVLLIETDLRRPSIGRYLNMSEVDKGVVSVTNGECTLSEAIYNLGNDNTKLDMLLADQRLSNPLDLLASQAFKNIVKQAKEDYDLVILDCSPIGLVSDSLLVGTIAGNALFIVKAGQAHARQTKQALEQLDSSGTQLLGTVLNQQTRSRMNPYGYYYYYGGYGNYR